jgi:hypothetical protein
MIHWIIGFFPLTLADARFILEPDFDLALARHALEMGDKRAREVFL